MTAWESSTQSLPPDTRRNGTVVGLRIAQDGSTLELGPGPRRWLIGTGANCDFVVLDPYVSTVHCILERTSSGALYVRDRKSRNGTQVDGNYVEGAEVRVGSFIQIGNTTLTAVTATGSVTTRAIEILRGQDPGLRATIEQAQRAAQTDCNVLIIGETGTGKDILARVVHEGSRRQRGAFVPVNCGAIPRELIGSELFGHDKGAFTGAHTDRDGYFVEAHGGSLFLDELGELPLEMQPHLLRALETRTVRRVGGSSERAVDVRIIAATNRLAGLGTEASKLRLDLYHRVATVVLMLSPLRDRMGDLEELVESMLVELTGKAGVKKVSDEAWQTLAAYQWPGNVRELRHAVARAVALGGEDLGPMDFFPELRFGRSTPIGANAHFGPALVPYQSMMRGAMEQALITYGSIRAAAAHLGMAKSTFADKAKQWGLVPRLKQRGLLRR